MKSGDKKPKIKAEWLSQNQMAASIGITRQAFSRWGVEPVTKIGGTSYYTVASVLDNRISNALLRSKQAQPEPAEFGDIDHEKYRLTKAQADAQEHKNEIATQVVVPVNFATYALAKISSEAASILDSVPLDLKRKNPEFSVVQIENIKHCISKASRAVVQLPGILPGLLDEYLIQAERSL